MGISIFRKFSALNIYGMRITLLFAFSLHRPKINFPQKCARKLCLQTRVSMTPHVTIYHFLSVCDKIIMISTIFSLDVRKKVELVIIGLL